MDAATHRPLTTDEAATALGLRPKTLCNMRSIGGGPKYLRLGAGGRAVRYDPRDLEDWKAERRVGSTSDPLSL